MAYATTGQCRKTTRIQGEEEQSMKPTEELMAEHDGILLMLKVLAAIKGGMEAGEAAPMDHIRQVLEFLQVFVDTCHHGKEEEALFPAMEKEGIRREGGPIGVMLGEHEAGRGFVKKMVESLSGLEPARDEAKTAFSVSAESYIGLLRQHIDKENNVLFPMADRFLSTEVQKRVSSEFERIEREKIGEGRHEAFHKMMDQLAEAYSV